jgi:RNase H
VANCGFQLSYIDDFSISVASTSAEKNCRNLTILATTLFNLAESNGIQFDPAKTELIHFHRGRTPIIQGLTVAGITVEPSETVRWLGIWFDSKLTFKQHIEKRLNAANATYHGLQRLCPTTHKGMPFRAFRQLYTACITTIADFGVQLWWGSKRHIQHIQRYQKIQNLAIIRALGAFKGSPYRALELEAAIPPPHIRFQKLCNSYSIRLLQLLQNHPIKQAIYQPIRDELAEPTEALPLFQDLQPTTQLLRLAIGLRDILDSHYRVEDLTLKQWIQPWKAMPTTTTNNNKILTTTTTISNSSKKLAKNEHLALLSSLHTNTDILTVIFYTDASKGINIRNESTNSAALCQIGPNSNTLQAKYWNLGPTVEVADAELIAIYKALRAILALSKQRLIVDGYIFSDSQAAVRKIFSHSQYASMARKAIQQLAKLHTHIHIHWCPSHCGIYGNELADHLAKKGLDSPIISQYPTSISYIRRMAKEAIITRWKASWFEEEEKESRGLKSAGLGIQYRLIARDMLSFSTKPKLPVLPRARLAAYIQLKTGIGYLKPYLRRIGKLPDDNCSTCNKRQTTAHLIMYCKKYRTERKQLQKDLRGLPLTLQVLFSTNKGKEALRAFLISTEIATAAWISEQ